MTDTVRTRLDALELATAGLNAAELAVLNSVTAGTVTASKAVVVDVNKDVSAFRNVTVTNLDAGVSGTAGSVDIFPITAARGKIAITATANTGDTITAITNAVQAAARTYTIPDAGASGAFVMGGGNTAVALTGTGGTSTGTMTTLSAQATTQALTTAGQATHVATITYTGIAATDIVFATLVGGTNTVESIILRATCTLNTITVRITNATAATAVNGTIIFNLLVVKV